MIYDLYDGLARVLIYQEHCNFLIKALDVHVLEPQQMVDSTAYVGAQAATSARLLSAPT